MTTSHGSFLGDQPSNLRWIVDGKAETCRTILTSLPSWFGRRDAIDTYCRRADTLPMIGVVEGDLVVGFASLGNPTPACTEIHVMAVRPQRRRQGVGRLLVAAAERHTQENGRAFLSVKTLGSSNTDTHYQETRSFYEAVGFHSIEEFPDYWGRGLPMSLMVMRID